jgi:hypothetical protein
MMARGVIGGSSTDSAFNRYTSACPVRSGAASRHSPGPSSGGRIGRIIDARANSFQPITVRLEMPGHEPAVRTTVVPTPSRSSPPAAMKAVSDSR